jgi:hypothetical protein
LREHGHFGDEARLFKAADLFIAYLFGDVNGTTASGESRRANAPGSGLSWRGKAIRTERD